MSWKWLAWLVAVGAFAFVVHVSYLFFYRLLGL
jgi:hypothetical protein